MNVQKWHLVTTYKLFINVDYCLHPNVYLDSINLTEYVFICKDWVNNHIVIERTLNEKEKRNPKYQNCQTTIVLTLPTATYTGIYIYIYILRDRQTERKRQKKTDFQRQRNSAHLKLKFSLCFLHFKESTAQMQF